MSPIVWLIAVVVGAVIGGGLSALRRPHGVVVSLAMGVVGGGIGAWLAYVFGVAVESRIVLGAAAAVGALVLTALSWTLRRA